MAGIDGSGQAETARLLGMTQQNLSQIEDGRQAMSYEQRQRAMTVLGIPAEDLRLSPGRPPAELEPPLPLIRLGGVRSAAGSTSTAAS